MGKEEKGTPAAPPRAALGSDDALADSDSPTLDSLPDSPPASPAILPRPNLPNLTDSRPDGPRVGIPRVLQKWERYEVLEVLGAGGMGAVYKARDPRLQRLVAVKIIHPGLGHTAGTTGEILLRRFEREARLQAALEHPHICKLLARCRSGDGMK